MHRFGKFLSLIALAVLMWTTAVRPTHAQTNEPETATTPSAATSLPVGKTVYKISVTEEGIYRITPAQLPNINPQKVQMLYKGQPLAYQFIGNGDTVFQEGEEIRFYGWPFDDSRAERQHVSENIYWLWEGDTPTRVQSATNETGNSTKTTYTASLTFEEDNLYYQTRLGLGDADNSPPIPGWPDMPNEPDSFYWEYIYDPNNVGNATVTRSFPINLPNPVTSSSQDVVLTAEFLSRGNTSPNRDFGTQHVSVIDINDEGLDFTDNWLYIRNINAVHTFDPSLLLDGINTVKISNGTPESIFYLNRIMVDYPSRLRAENDRLIFGWQGSGSNEYKIDGFSTSSTSNIVFWDVSNRLQPVSITARSSGTGTFSFGRTHAANARFAATTTSQLLPTTGKISSYFVKDITPPTNVDWLAVAYGDFVDEATQLAAHRASHSGLDTYVVDVADVINQYGYGLPTPFGIRNYLRYVSDRNGWNWPSTRGYVTLIGDATVNPRQRPCDRCTQGQADWSKKETDYVPTFFSFVDRFDGLVPSDFLYTIPDSSLEPDFAIGRLSVQTSAQAQIVVDKIILYETNLKSAQDFQQEMLFLHDNADSGGDFLSSTQATVSGLPNSFNTTVAGLPTTTVPGLKDTIQIKSQLGLSLLNWRGHGSIDFWANERIVTVADIQAPSLPLFRNTNAPLVSLSMDCLDGNFILPGRDSISEALLRLPNGTGSAAHWSSSGLGYLVEHDVFSKGFYDALFKLGYTAIGDAVNYSKVYFAQQGQTSPGNWKVLFDESELHAFVLQGDPAMQLFQPELSLSASVSPGGRVKAGDNVAVNLTVENSGSYPTPVTLTYPLPAGTAYVSHSVIGAPTVNFSQSSAGGTTVLTFAFPDSIAYRQTASVKINLRAATNISPRSTTAQIITYRGLDASPQTGFSAIVTLGADSKVFLPAIARP